MASDVARSVSQGQPLLWAGVGVMRRSRREGEGGGPGWMVMDPGRIVRPPERRRCRRRGAVMCQLRWAGGGGLSGLPARKEAAWVQ